MSLMEFLVYKVLRAIVVRFLGKVDGIENIPSSGGYIIASNHSSQIDTLIVPLVFWDNFKIRPRFLAKKELFRKYFARKYFAIAKTIPIDRQAGGKEALREALNALAAGDKIAIFPEGTRSFDGNLQRAKTGVARLALWAKVPVIPVGVIGGYEAWPKGKLLPRFRKVDVKIGKPIMFEGNPEDKEVLTKITTHVMKKIALLTGKTYDFD